MSKIIGVTVGTTLPKPNFKQTDPTKGDYIKNKPDFDGLKSKVEQIEVRVDTIQKNAYDDTELRGVVSENVARIDTLNELVGNTKVETQIGDVVAILESEIDNKLNTMQSAIDSKVDAEGGKGLSTNDYTTSEKDKLATVEDYANFYEHPAHDSHDLGLYKVAVDDEGHVSNVALVEKEDIVALGIPAQDTTYEEEISDLSDRIDDVENNINTTNETLTGLSQDFENYKTTNNEAVASNATGIQGNKLDIEAIQADYLTSANQTQLQDNIDQVSAKANANESAIATLNGEGDGSVKKSINNAFNEFAANVTNDDVVNTYKELIDYAATHGPEFTELVGKVDTIDTHVGEIETDLFNYKTAVSDQFAEVDTTINTMQEALDEKADLEHAHEIGEINSLQDSLDGLQADIDAKADLEHEHNDLYYTKDEILESITVDDIDDICGSNQIPDGDFDFITGCFVAQPEAPSDTSVLWLDTDDNSADSGGNVDYTVYGLPVLYLTGDTTGMSKDDAVSLGYVYGEHYGTASVKWQGSSSLAYPKKNYTIKFDNAFEAAPGWGTQKKYCLKANYIDHSHARNVVCAKLWGEMTKSRGTKNDKLADLPNGGAIDGFPVIIVLNGEFHGLYTWNIPKDEWLFGMGDGEHEAVVGADNPLSADVSFKGDTLLDGNGLELEYASNKDDVEWVIASLNQMIQACINSDGSDLDTVVSQYLDLNSAIDYLLLVVFIGGSDMVTRNYLLSTFDGIKWFFSAYDMDSVFGLQWDGKYFFNACVAPTFASFNDKHRAMELIYRFKTDAIRKRWAQLRNGTLSEPHICQVLENFVAPIPSVVYMEDVKRWPSIPGSSVNTLDQILRWVHQRLEIVDKWVAALPSQEVPGQTTTETLYNGLSGLWGDGYFFNETATLNLDTLELTTANASASYCTTKAIAVKPNTEYAIPNIANSSVITYNSSGLYDGTVKPADSDDGQIVTTKSTTSYLVFCFYKPTYPDYANFYIRKIVAPGTETPVEPEGENLYNGLSELYPDGGYVNWKGTLNVETLEVSAVDPSASYCVTKAVEVEPSTEYIIPNIAGSEIFAYKTDGTFSTKVTPVDADGYQTITTNAATHYLVFCFYKPGYSDYENFYIKKSKS